MKDGGQDRFRLKNGLPIATYFSGPKVRWILDNVDGAQARADAGDLLFGNIDTWCIWNLTGGTNGGLHITDVSNASRTMLMNLADARVGRRAARRDRRTPLDASRDHALECRRTGRSRAASSRGSRWPATSATSRRRRSVRPASRSGEAKNTYGTGNFLLLNTGNEAVQSKNGLITTVGYKIGDQKAGLLPRGLDRDHRGARAVAARQPQDDPDCS